MSQSFPFDTPPMSEIHPVICRISLERVAILNQESRPRRRLGLPGSTIRLQSATPGRAGAIKKRSVTVRRRTWMGLTLGSIAAPLGAYSAWQWRDDWVEKRYAVVVPGRIIRGAWQRPGPLRRIISRERIKTIVTLTAISRDDPKYVDQAKVVREMGVGWVFVPILGSYASLAQMEQAALILADPARQPIFYHCVAGHHRSSQAQAAYRIQHEGWSASRAWDEVAALPWAKPGKDLEDHRLIEAFASGQLQRKKDASNVASTVANLGPPPAPRVDGGDRPAGRLDVLDLG